MNRAQVSLSSLRVIDLGQPLGSWLLRSNQPRSFQDAHSACLAGLVALGATPLASLTSSSAAAHAAANAGAGARNAGDPRRLAALQSAKSTLAEGALGFEIWSEIMDAHKPEPFLATITRECGASSRSMAMATVLQVVVLQRVLFMGRQGKEAGQQRNFWSALLLRRSLGHLTPLMLLLTPLVVVMLLLVVLPALVVRAVNLRLVVLTPATISATSNNSSR